MKNLETYGVVSLDSKEMKETDGGNVWPWLALVYVADVLSNTEEHKKAWKTGWEAGWN